MGKCKGEKSGERGGGGKEFRGRDGDGKGREGGLGRVWMHCEDILKGRTAKSLLHISCFSQFLCSYSIKI